MSEVRIQGEIEAFHITDQEYQKIHETFERFLAIEVVRPAIDQGIAYWIGFFPAKWKGSMICLIELGTDTQPTIYARALGLGAAQAFGSALECIRGILRHQGVRGVNGVEGIAPTAVGA